MFSVRVVPWHGLGNIVSEAKTSKEAQELAGMNWNAQFAPISAEISADFSPATCGVGFTKKIPHRFAVVRDTDLHVMGVVSDDYRIVQNSEAFSIMDSIVDTGDVRYETAGVLKNPVTGDIKTWMLVSAKDIRVLGDTVSPYCVFMNSFDGKSGMVAAMTPVRVVCQNTLTLALEHDHTRKWSITHLGDIQSKIKEAQRALGIMAGYVDGFPEAAEALNARNLYADEIKKFLDDLFPAPAIDTEIRARNRDYMKGLVLNRFEKPEDLARFRGTAWGMYNAVSDVVTHMEPMRKTKSWQQNRFLRVVDGHSIIDRAQHLLMKIKI